MPQRLPTIRKATPTDSAGILECLRAAFAAYRSSYAPEAYLDTVLTPDTLQHRLATMCVFVAVSDGDEIVGTIGCCVIGPDIHSPAADTGEGHIRGMAVVPTWQGSGVAAQLLKSVESELRAKGCSRISLDTTEPLQPAIRFYEKNGFRRSGKVADFYGMPLFEYVKTPAE
jgi:ribosomal protein S18 acetylase RimI-like enzyme